VTTKVDGSAEVSAHELGGWLALSVRRVNDMAARGILKKLGRGKFPLRESIRAYAEHVREIAAGRVAAMGGEEGLDLVHERARLAREQANKAQRENAIADRRVCLTDVAAEVFGRECATIRTALLAIPRERAPALHRAKTPAELEALLAETIHEVLGQLSAGEQIVGQAIEIGPTP
jgi:phage terminase Nu1 subunit (DNA packaging protein)